MIENKFLNFTPPSIQTLERITAPLRLYFSPVFYGMENIESKQPHLFVANHTIHGVLDVPLYGVEVYRQKGFLLRGLADHFHYLIPIWRDFISWIGSVPGTVEHCEKLMENRENILVFPGGGREVCKRKGEGYQLIWKQRTGFARLAIKHHYTILPIASIGIDDAFSILFDRNDIMNSIVGKMLNWSRIFDHPLLKKGEEIPAITRGLGLTPLPRPERVYVSFGKPIDTKPFKGLHHDKEALMTLRTLVEDAINEQLGQLLLLRYRDSNSSLLRRLLNRL
ncbi:MAG: acyltransferase family protein [Candidatus Magnetomorum sp.]|nr:acyltransferase family protein [Candidatus Magnetomorum sp.]